MTDKIETTDGLRAVYGEPGDRARRKEIRAFEKHSRHFISLSPFLVLATSGPDGRLDASPRGDAPGFVGVLDDTTLLLPDRPGNNRIDSLTNVVVAPQVGMIFFVPGIDETLRVNGRASVTTDADLLGRHAVGGKVPKTGLLIAAEEIYFHCAKALIRSRLWDPAARVERDAFPSLGRVIADQISGVDVVEAEAAIAEGYRDRLY